MSGNDFRADLDTIAAVATAPGTGGVGVIRISGPKAHDILLSLFRPSAPSFRDFTPRMLHHGRILDAQNREADEALVVFFKAPHSFTGEDCAEIQGHAQAVHPNRLREREGCEHEPIASIGASAQIGRTAGLEAAVEANDNWTLLAAESGEFTQAKGQEVMESMLKQYGDDIDVVYCENDNEAFGAIDAIEAAGYTVGPDGDILVMSFDSTNAGLTDVLNGKIICNTECNPLHGPRVKEIIDKLEAGETPDKQQYVEEEIFAGVDLVPTVTVDGSDYAVTVVTEEVISSRAY